MNKPLFPEVGVNGETISAADIAAEAQNHDAPKGKPGLAWRKAAKALVIRKLLLQEALHLGISATPRETAPGRTETGDEAVIRAVLEQALEIKAPDEAVLRAAYDANPTRFTSPTLYEAAHILFLADPVDLVARTKAMEKATAALGILANHPERFAQLARSESDCPSRDNGGHLGQITTGDTVPEFEAALDALEIGQIARAPVPSRYGVHVVRLDAKASGAVLPYTAVRTRICEAFEKAAWARAANDYVEALLSRADVRGLDLRAVA